MYKNYVVSIVFLSFLIFWIWFTNLVQDRKIEAYKDELIDNESQLVDGTGGFVDTDKEGLPEIVVDPDVFDEMPQVEEELSKKEVLENEPESRKDIPEEINLWVTFYPQAPDWDWSLPWKEACEESSIVQAYYFLKQKELTKEVFKREVLDIVAIQKEILWKYIDSSMTETARFLEAKYDYTDYEIIDNPSVEDMKYELAQWHPIIVPFAGKELWNSFFTNGWPRYHVLVMVWYSEDHFITNDVWTSRGENFAYSYDTIMESMHDLIPLWEWDIRDGAKRILVMR